MLPIGQTLDDLPQPAPEALAHSRRVAEHIRTAIRAADGRISFERYMQLVLYAPGLGYYSAGARKFGAAGDFVTAPEVSPLFSHCLARQCAEVLAAVEGGSLLELGAGSGVMAADVLLELERLGSLPWEYLILEVSADLRERQQRLLADKAPQLAGKVHWIDVLPEKFAGVVFGNELLDALPVERFRKTQQGFQQFCVREQGEGFVWELKSAPSRLAAELERLELTLPAPLPPDYASEYCPGLKPLVSGLGQMLEQGALLFMDYGYPRAAYYHPDRCMGTLMCHYRQRAHEDVFLHPGLQDITAYVDFTAVAEAGEEAGLELAGYSTQAHFLMGLDIATMAGGDIGLAQQVKLLTLPDEMGERFKAIGFTRKLDLPLSGFALRDLSRML